MNPVFTSRTARGRFAVLACLVVTPLLNYLRRNEYSLARPESIAILTLLLAECLLLAAISGARSVFYPLVSICIGLTCATPVCWVMASWFFLAHWQGFVAAALLGTAALLLMREKFLPVLAVLAAASHCAVVLSHAPRRFVLGSESAPAAIPHVLYLILDEHLGIAGFPPEICECASAAKTVSAVLFAHNFAVYPNAYSNYPVTVDSLPSFLNRTLLAHSRQMIRQRESGASVYSLSSNRLVRDLRSLGKSAFVVQHSSFDLNAGTPANRLEYADSLGDLQLVDGHWTRKARWIVGGYQASDRMLRQVNAFFPFRLGSHITGPLAIRKIWPSGLAGEIARARTPTLFLAHLMIPHGPYLYRKDGSMRPLEEWSADRVDRRLVPVVYRETYQRYCEQVEYLSSELDKFFLQLSAAGAFDSMTVVVHGDHGSRIRSVVPVGTYAAAAASSPERFDYAGDPDLRDLLSRFSVLMAIKTPQQASPRINPGKESLLKILERDFYGSTRDEFGPAADDVYLFSEVGASRPIPILKYWR